MAPLRGGARYPTCNNRRGIPMLDIVYLALGVGGFVALMLATRALGRL